MILEGLADSATALDYSDHWSPEDVHGITVYSAEHAAADLDEE